MQKNSNFQLGLLHFIHFLVKVDGRIDERERLAIIKIRKEENISDSVFKDFEKSVLSRSEQEIYSRGAELLIHAQKKKRFVLSFTYTDWRKQIRF